MTHNLKIFRVLSRNSEYSDMYAAMVMQRNEIYKTGELGAASSCSLFFAVLCHLSQGIDRHTGAQIATFATVFALFRTALRARFPTPVDLSDLARI